MHYVTETESREVFDEARHWLETKQSLGLFVCNENQEDLILISIAEFLANTKYDATIYHHLAKESPFRND